MSKVIIIGAGAAGMMAAYSAAKCGHEVTIIEKNEKCGKKLFITGKGRCNLTNACDAEEFFDKIVTNPKFMYSAFYTFTNYQCMDLFENEFGLEIKTERGQRVFTASDKSYDVINALKGALKKAGVRIILNKKVTELIITDNVVCGVKCGDEEFRAHAVIVATGGNSYKSTGSDGDGYRFAKAAGHTIKNVEPALVPLVTKEAWVKDLQGLSLRNIGVTYMSGSKVIYSDFGEMIFTHYGVSGPVVLTASSYIGKKINGGSITMIIDLKPALKDQQLEARIIRDFEEKPNLIFKNSLSKLLPKKLIPVIVSLSGIDPMKQVNSVTREERIKLVQLLKNLTCTITGLRDFNEAIVTRGGVCVKEVVPGTMESKLCKHLYFAGEVLDVDAVTGGFNLQVAWSTGYLAGMEIE